MDILVEVDDKGRRRYGTYSIDFYKGCKSRLLFAKIAMAIWFQLSA